MPTANRELPEKPLWFRLMGSAEGLLSLAIAIGIWVYALRPVGPMVGMPVEAFLRDMAPLLPAVTGFALAVGGIRHGHRFARWAGWGAAVLLLPLIILLVVMGARRSFLA